MTKVSIIALDGLEYNLVVRLRKKYLLQKHYGRVSLRGFGELWTPTLWASFLTGHRFYKSMLVSDVELLDRFEGRILNAVMRRLYELYSSLRLSRLLDPGLAIRYLDPLLEKLGAVESTSGPIELIMGKNLPIESFLDVAEPIITVNVPFYDYDPPPGHRMLFSEAFRSQSGYDNFKAVELRHFRSIATKTLDKMQNQYSVLMAYSTLADRIGHLRVGDPREMLEVYSAMDSFVAKVVSKAQGTVLVISDHGMTPVSRRSVYGDHSGYGFWSCNETLGLETPLIIDFYGVIERLRQKH